MMRPLNQLTLEEAAARLARGDITSVELTEACLQAIRQIDSKINSFVAVFPESALEEARASDDRRKAGTTLGILDGIPYNLKDVYATKGRVTTASSRMLSAWISPYDATVYRRLSDAGAVLLGKTNTDEFTMGSSTETSYQGVTRNPWNTERVAGGSSGGPTASVAAHLSIFSVATDTGGSIRQPAAFCGVTGLRPTYGRISRFGEIAMASSLDQTGPVTKTVRDAAIVLSILAGKDPLDATSADVPLGEYLKACEKLSGDRPLQGMRGGVIREYFGEGVRPDVEAQVRTAITTMEKLGMEFEEISLPAVAHALAIYYIIAPAEVSSNMARYDGIHYGYSVESDPSKKPEDLYAVYAESRAAGFGAEVQRRIMLGTHVLSSGYHDAYYRQAEEARIAVTEEFAEAFTRFDVLVGPVSPHPAFAVGEKVQDPLAMYKEDILTVALNIGGIAGMSVPCGYTDGLPVGLQLMSGAFQEENILKAGSAYQQVTDYHMQLPTLLTTATV